MDITGPSNQSILDSAKEFLAKLGPIKTVFTVTTFAWCVIHFLTSHSISFYVFSGALACGGLAAAVFAGVSTLVRKRRMRRAASAVEV